MANLKDSSLIEWLLKGDVSVQYQVRRDMLGDESNILQKRIASEGWGAAFLARRGKNGHWGQRYYQPKWISTHYTLLDLRNLAIFPENPLIGESLDQVFRKEKGPDGGILPIGNEKKCDVCVNGMVLNFATYFGVPEDDLKSVVDFLLAEKMSDGGFNCLSNTRGAVHSSLHTTLSVAEGILEYRKNGYTYRWDELNQAELDCREFILIHRLFRSDKTGKVINDKMLRFYYPCRWYYDILRALDYFQAAGASYDTRMADALEVLIKKRKKDGTWHLPAKHSGQVHFEMEKAGQPSRWNTMRALRVLKHFAI